MSESNLKLDGAEKLVARGRLSRREFMQIALAAGLTTSAASAAS